jgi:transposase
MPNPVTDLPPACIAMEAGTHSIWLSEQLQGLGHEVIVANVRELRAISHGDRKSDHADAEKLARFARLDRRSCAPSRTAQSNSRKPLG